MNPSLMKGTYKSVGFRSKLCYFIRSNCALALAVRPPILKMTADLV